MAAAVNHEPLVPASATGRLDEEVHAVATGVPSRWGGSYEGDRERLIGMGPRHLSIRGAAKAVAMTSIAELYS